VRRNRRRFWKSELNTDKHAAYATLYEVLVETIHLLAPFAPFVSEEIYQNILRSVSAEAPESVHLCDYPQAKAHLIDEDLESRMEATRRIVVLGRSARNRTGIKVRQPLLRLSVVYTGDGTKPSLKEMVTIIAEELNVKEIRFLQEAEDLYTLRAKPNFKALGPKFGGTVKAVAETIKELAPEEVTRLKRDGSLTLSVGGKDVELAIGDVDIATEEGEGSAVEKDEVFTVALDTHITEDLKDEGYAREFVNRTQTTRKMAGFLVTDRIDIYFRTTDRLRKAIQAMSDYIQQETLALNIFDDDRPGTFHQEWDIEGEKVVIAVEKCVQDEGRTNEKE
jgi:isoleucyl-tRNA synthetase